MCLSPRAVTASGNSATPFFLERVTFFTSTKIFLLFFDIKKSNLVFLPNLTSLFILSRFLSSLIEFSSKASRTILLVKCVFTPTIDFLFSII